MMDPFISATLTFIISFSYILAIYLPDFSLFLKNKEKKNTKLKRDDPKEIKKRAIKVSLVIIFNILIFYKWEYFSSFLSPTDSKISLFELGLIPGYNLITIKGTKIRYWEYDLKLYFFNCLKISKLFLILFIGPLADQLFNYILYCKYYNNSNNNKNINNSRKIILSAISFDIWGFRNYVFGPITEEIVYTGITLYNYNFKNYWGLPLFFGLAHIHHGYELYHENKSLLNIVVIVFIQLSYTTLFGYLTNTIYLKYNGNLMGCILFHSFANYMGFPSLSPRCLYENPILLKYSSENTNIKNRNGICMFLVKVIRLIYFVLLIIGLLDFTVKVFTL
ncbi:CAAX prenyl protease SCDLUD_001279 [Saccharomycodes ludwigii]|uniref:CAAX prenyl protease n=1 Tax=Saccharomycodes ludwigii TaxID=36035 RepID=UPI001E88766C|nr:hypothetical protein SCDLUD_001279 [Saccharomycodes ludwigii]KAH3903634.1 hypothetical protein SCDLUD_001279 [Saccharomycodes ludwigii]